MHHYPHHIADFNNATRHLTRVERSLYREGIDLYYETEQPLTGDLIKLSKKLLARTDEEKQGLIDVLAEFFDLADGNYVHHRCEEEILKFKGMTTAKSAAGKASALARATRKADRLKSKNQHNLTGVEQVLNPVATEPQQNPTNLEPRTENLEPRTNIKDKPQTAKFNFKESLIELGVNSTIASDFLKVRSKKKATNTQTAFKGLTAQIVKSGMTPNEAITLSVEKSWAGFNSEWVDGSNGKKAIAPPKSFSDKDYGDVVGSL